jgi:hypothetical protein
MIPVVRKGIYCEQSNQFGYSIENAVNKLSIILMETEKCGLARCEIFSNETPLA